MAKPLSVASSDCPGTSKSISNSSQAAALPVHRPSQRRYRNFKHSGPRPTPSSGLLILLASLASSASIANGSPTPLSFLCPSVGSEDIIDLPPVRRASSSSPSPSHDIVSKATELPSVVAPRHVPDRFSQGPDGVWRRVGSYTLYGSTVSACVGQTCRTPTNAVSNVDVDDQIQVGANQSIANDTDSATTSYDFKDSLPPGWKPNPKPYANRTPLILAMSLVLACLICFFIFGCLFWRRNMKKYYKGHDIEAKARKKRRANSEEAARELATEKEVKAKQKLWARATARWKANARYSARQRRGKRPSIRSSHPNQSSYSVDGSQGHLHSTISRTSSRTASTVSIPDQLHEDTLQAVSQSPSLAVITIISTPPSPQLVVPALPPAYQHQGQIPPIIISVDGTSSEEYSESPDSGRARRPSHSSTYTTSAITNGGQNEDLSPRGPLHAAHLATDDKSLLAHLANLASSPPEDRTSHSAEMSLAAVSAPVWVDEEIGATLPQLIPASSSQPSCSPSPMFPPPPSKERLAASEFYHYPFTFDEMESLEADSEPSAPPFEENSLPQNSDLLLPSAPPLLDADDFSSQQPSAPELDSEEPSEENPIGQGHDRMDLPQGPAVSSYPPSSLPSESVSNPTTDTIALPGYRP